MHAFVPRLQPLEDRTTPATFTVLNTADSGLGSLRQAILDSNANLGPDEIDFNVGGGGVQTIRPSTSLPVITDAVVIDGTTQPGFAGSPLIVLNGNAFIGGQNGHGLFITAGNSTVRGLVINGFTGTQIMIAASDNNLIVGNYIGTDVTGTSAVLGSPSIANVGLEIRSSNNTIGGTSAEDRNLISGHNGWGIRISGSLLSGNRVQGNFIGTDVTGTRSVGNTTGVEVSSGNPGGAFPNPSAVIGGTVAGAGNLISGNGFGLTLWAQQVVVQGNYIGTDVTGTQALANGSGIDFNSGIGTLIGGTTAAERNIISGNLGPGINSYQGGVFNNSRIEGNYIGTDVTGTLALGNFIGVSFHGPDNSLGGTAPGAGNVISGNTSFGILIQAAGSVVLGNLVGTDATGTSALGNGGAGIAFFGSSNSLIGGTEVGAGNTIAFNGRDGVVVHDQTGLSIQTGISIRGNSIHSNAELGIDLGDDGVTRNDRRDVDTGANTRQNFPRLREIQTGTSTVVSGVLRSTPSTTFVLDFYASAALDPSGFGEGARYLGSGVVVTDGAGIARFEVTLTATASDEVVTATATDPAGNTSEFSRGPIADLRVTKLASRLTASVGQQVTFTIIVTNLGRNAALNAILIDRLPGELRFVSAATSVGSYESSTGRWAIGTLAPGESAVLRLTVRVAQPGIIRNTARISSSVFDPNESNNTATAVVSTGSIFLSKRLLLASRFR